MNKLISGVDFSRVTPDTVKKVRDAIAGTGYSRHSYSASGVYAAHNAAFGLSEKPQMCTSCVYTRVNNLRRWLSAYDEYVAAHMPGETIGDDEDDAANPQRGMLAAGGVVQADGAIRYATKDGPEIDFLPDEGTAVKGSATWADGSKIRVGRYLTAEGLEIVVQPGGRANIRGGLV